MTFRKEMLWLALLLAALSLACLYAYFKAAEDHAVHASGDTFVSIGSECVSGVHASRCETDAAEVRRNHAELVALLSARKINVPEHLR